MKDHGILFGRLYRVNYSGSGPPWPMQVWDNSGGGWQAIGIRPASGVLYEYGPRGLEFVLTSEGNVIGDGG